MLSRWRGKFARLDKAVGARCSFLSPDSWTFLSIAFGMVAFLLVLRVRFDLAAFFVALAGLCDGIDGAVARVRGASKRGAYIDTIADRYVEFLAIAGMFIIPLPPLWIPAAAWAALYLFGSLLTTYAKAAAREKGLVRTELIGGVIERQERMIFLVIAFLLASRSPAYLVWMIAALALLANATALQRIGAALGNSHV